MHIEVIEVEFVFYPLPEFEEEAKKLWGADRFEEMLHEIADNLYRGDHIGANIWKVRIKAKGKGKRGGARIIYLQLNEDQAVLLLEAYGKNEKEDLNPGEERELVEFAKTLDLKGVLDDGKETARRIKAQVKNRGGLQQGKAGAQSPSGENKNSRRKKDKGKR